VKLKTLKSRLPTLGSSLSNVPRIGATPRQRGSVWMRRREQWLHHNPLCVECMRAGRAAAAEEVDHVIPLADGGDDDESNLQSLCKPCHMAKTAREAAARARGEISPPGG